MASILSVGKFQGHGDGVDALTPTQTSARAGRRDGRAAGEMRPISVTQGLLSAADGSARVRMGTTDVLVAIYGPMDCPVPRQKAERVEVQAAFKKRDQGSLGENVNAGMEMVSSTNIRQLVLEIVLATLHPRKAIVVAVQVLADHGGMLAAAINATALALIDSGMSMTAVPTAASVSVHNGVLVVDPVRVEETEAEAVITFTFDTASDTAAGFMSVYTEGDCGGEELFANAMRTCRQLAEKTRAFHKISLEKKASHAYVWNSPTTNP